MIYVTIGYNWNLAMSLDWKPRVGDTRTLPISTEYCDAYDVAEEYSAAKFSTCKHPDQPQGRPSLGCHLNAGSHYSLYSEVPEKLNKQVVDVEVDEYEYSVVQKNSVKSIL